ncbi:MAG: hypothetical protein WCP18_01040 [bacterium]
MPTEKISQEQKIWGAVSYLWVFSIVALASRKKDEYIRFHANQGAFLFVASIPLMFIPMLGWLLVGIIAIVGIINALQGEKWELPLVGEMPKQLGDWIIKTIKL